jgi:hypothetical protein
LMVGVTEGLEVEAGPGEEAPGSRWRHQALPGPSRNPLAAHGSRVPAACAWPPRWAVPAAIFRGPDLDLHTVCIAFPLPLDRQLLC